MGGWVDAHVAWIHFHAFTVCPWDGTSVRLASVYYLPRLGLFESPRELVQIHTAALLEHYILSASDGHLALLFHHSVSQSVSQSIFFSNLRAGGREERVGIAMAWAWAWAYEPLGL